MSDCTNAATPQILVAGFASGFEALERAVADLECQVAWVAEDSVGAVAEHSVDCVLFLAERDTWYSSQLYALFTWLERSINAHHWFVVLIERCSRDGAMPSLLTTTEIEVSDVNRVLQGIFTHGGNHGSANGK